MSEQMTVVQPSVSTEGSLRTMHFRLAIDRVPNDKHLQVREVNKMEIQSISQSIIKSLKIQSITQSMKNHSLNEKSIIEKSNKKRNPLHNKIPLQGNHGRETFGNGGHTQSDSHFEIINTTSEEPSELRICKMLIVHHPDHHTNPHNHLA